MLFSKRVYIYLGWSYPKENLDGLGAGGTRGSTWNILSDHSKGSIALSTATVVLMNTNTINMYTHTFCMYIVLPMWF